MFQLWGTVSLVTVIFVICGRTLTPPPSSPADDSIVQPSALPYQAPAATAAAPANDLDLLGGLMGGPPAPAPAQPSQPVGGDLLGGLDLLGGAPALAAAAAVAPPPNLATLEIPLASIEPGT